MALFSPGQDGAPLALVSLGVVGDDRPLPELQPKLPEGIHLRWSFQRSSTPSADRGFPWYGFYLLRRLTPTGTAVCASSQLGGFAPGPLTTSSLSIPLGTFSSDEKLRLTDDFAPFGTVELDLSGRKFVRYQAPTGGEKRRIDVTVGFVADFPSTGGGGPGPGDGTTGGGGLGDGNDGGGPIDDGPSDGGGLGTGPSGGDGPTDGGPTGGGGPIGGGPTGGGPSSGGPTGDLGGDRGGPVLCACGCGVASQVRPIVERVVSLGNGTYRVTFGYSNPSSTAISLPAGPLNGFSPNPAFRGQPTLFLPGVHHNAFSVVFSGAPISWTLGGFSTATSSASAAAPTEADGIIVVAFRGLFPVGFRVLSGRAGEVVSTQIGFEAIDSIAISAGPARLIDLCAVPNEDSAGLDWAPVPNFPQPMLLPVSHENYPLNNGSPDVVSAEATAMARIRYAFPVPNTSPPVLDKSNWQGANFDALHQILVAIVQNGPGSGITDVVEILEAEPDSEDPAASRPSVTNSLLNLLLLGAANPAVAQMLGLYWVDDTAIEGQSYDYLIVADNSNVAAGNVSTILARVAVSDYSNLDAYRKDAVFRARSAPLQPPATPDSYALPVGAVAPPAPADAAGLVGLRWQMTEPADLPHLAPDSAFLFMIWRRDFGLVDPINPTSTGYSLITDVPFAPSALRLSDPPQPLTGWPTFGLFYVDGPLVEGFYGYCTNGIDIFGRYSALSAPARWVDVDTGEQLSPAAVHLIDKIPPPAPTRVQAWILDPGDPALIKDAAYTAWRSSLGPSGEGTIGLRVRWTWPARALQQAPDTREFRVYAQPGSAITDAAVATNWERRVAVVSVNERIVIDETVPVKNVDGVVLSGSSASIEVLTNSSNGSVESVTVTLADAARLDGLPAEGLELELTAAPGGPARFTVIGIDNAAKVLRLKQDPGIAASAWTIYRERTYELFLPGTALATAPPNLSLPTAPSLTVPVSYGLIGVSAADNKDREDPRASNLGPLVPRPGNEGDVGGPATVYQVWREKPAAPAAAYDDERLVATRADFKGQSFFTLHFVKSPSLATDVFRALDETLFRIDADNSATRNAEIGALSAATLGWAQERFASASAEAAAVGTSGYASLSDDALRVLACLSSNGAAFTRLTTPSLPVETPDARGLSDTPDYDPGAHPMSGAYTDTLDGRASNRYFYRTAYVDAAQNQGPLGPSSPPVYLPRTALLDAPVLTKAVSSLEQLRVTLMYQTSRSPDVTTYRVYRTTDPARAADIRLMDLVATIEEVPSAERPVTNTWPDDDVKGLTTYLYRLVAVANESGRISEPSSAVGARAVDQALPVVPALTAEWVTLDAVTYAALSWTSGDETLLQERPKSISKWTNIGTWNPPGVYTVTDADAKPIVDFEFRLLVRKYTGALARGEPVTLVHLP